MVESQAVSGCSINFNNNPSHVVQSTVSQPDIVNVLVMFYIAK